MYFANSFIIHSIIGIFFLGIVLSVAVGVYSFINDKKPEKVIEDFFESLPNNLM